MISVEVLNIEIKNGTAPDFYQCLVTVKGGTSGWVQLSYKCRALDAPKVGTKFELELPGL